MMGVKKPAQLADDGVNGEGGRGRGRENEEERRETKRRIREYNVCLQCPFVFSGTLGGLGGFKWRVLT